MHTEDKVVKPFREYKVWQHSHDLALRIYRVTEDFPRTEMFGLTSQMRRASTSIPMNIAEGSAMGDAQFNRHLTIALGSAAELEYQLLLARDLGYLPEASYELCSGEIGAVKRQLVRLRSAIRQTIEGGAPTANGQWPTAATKGHQ